MQAGRFNRLDLEESFTDDPFGNTPAPDDCDEESSGTENPQSRIIPYQDQDVWACKKLIFWQILAQHNQKFRTFFPTFHTLQSICKIKMCVQEDDKNAAIHAKA